MIPVLLIASLKTETLSYKKPGYSLGLVFAVSVIRKVPHVDSERGHSAA